MSARFRGSWTPKGRTAGHPPTKGSSARKPPIVTNGGLPEAPPPLLPFWQQEEASGGSAGHPDPQSLRLFAHFHTKTNPAHCSRSTEDESWSCLTFHPRRLLLFAHFQPKTKPALCSPLAEDELCAAAHFQPMTNPAPFQVAGRIPHAGSRGASPLARLLFRVLTTFFIIEARAGGRGRKH